MLTEPTGIVEDYLFSIPERSSNLSFGNESSPTNASSNLESPRSSPGKHVNSIQIHSLKKVKQNQNQSDLEMIKNDIAKNNLNGYQAVQDEEEDNEDI